MGLESMTKRDFVKERCDRAIAAFQNHALVDDREDRWRICKREKDGKLTGIHAAEIVSLWGGRLYVGGDIDDCVFAYYSSSGKGETPREQHFAKLCWMGRCNDVSYYVRQKASMGLTDGGKLVDEFDERVAQEDLDFQMKGMLEGLQATAGDAEDGGEGEARRIKDLFDEAKARMIDPQMMRQRLYEDLDDLDAWEWLCSVGNIVSYRVVYAWAAVRRLCELLDEKDAHAI